MSSRRPPSVPTSPWTLVLVCAGSTALAAAISASGCEEKRPVSLTGGGGEAGAGGSTTSIAGEDKAKALYEGLDADLYAACGSCHDANGIADTPFLATPHYETITKWPGIVTKDPTQSKLVVHPVSGGGHLGSKNLDSPELNDTLFPKVKEWLAEESKKIADTPVEQKGKSVPPITVVLGFNAVYLTPISNEFTGMAITFNANELTPSSLELTEVEIHTTAKKGVHIVHPLFSVYPKNGNPDPDPADSFSNVDQYIDFGKHEALGPGTLILTNWTSDGLLQISFEEIEPYSTIDPDGGTDGGLAGGCKDLASFEANAKAQFGTCVAQCHAGGNSLATAAVDMSGLQNDTDVANACAQIRNRVSPADPPNSQLFKTTDPDGDAVHPYKFAQDKQAFAAFKGAVSLWIPKEQ